MEGRACYRYLFPALGEAPGKDPRKWVGCFEGLTWQSVPRGPDSQQVTNRGKGMEGPISAHSLQQSLKNKKKETIRMNESWLLWGKLEWSWCLQAIEIQVTTTSSWAAVVERGRMKVNVTCDALYCLKSNEWELYLGTLSLYWKLNLVWPFLIVLSCCGTHLWWLYWSSLRGCCLYSKSPSRSDGHVLVREILKYCYWKNYITWLLAASCV